MEDFIKRLTEACADKTKEEIIEILAQNASGKTPDCCKTHTGCGVCIDCNWIASLKKPVILITFVFVFLQLFFEGAMKGNGTGLDYIQIGHLRAIASCVYAGIVLLTTFVIGKTKFVKMHLTVCIALFVPTLIYPFFPHIGDWLQTISNAIRWMLYLYLIYIAIYMRVNLDLIKKGM